MIQGSFVANLALKGSFKMKQILVIFVILLLLATVFQCESKKKPTGPDLEDPNYYYSRDVDYKWTYVYLTAGCKVPGDSIAITAVNRSTRPEGSGLNLVSSEAPNDTGFVYQLGDSIFYIYNVKSYLHPYKILIRPVRGGTFWKDAYGWEYSILGIEDLYSSIAGETYQGCAKIKRTASGDNKIKYFWWAPEYGKVKEADYIQSGDSLYCEGAQELKRLDKPSVVP
jgi:hypothetical protein